MTFYLYHFTRPEHLGITLGTWNLVYVCEGIFLSRNHNLSNHLFNKNHDFDRKYGYLVRIALDGDKMSEHNKIRPVAGLTMNHPDVFNHNLNRERVSRDNGESEEVVKTHPLNIRPYIKRVDFLHGGRDNTSNERPDMTREFYHSFADRLDKEGITHRLDKKWHRAGLDESEYKDEYLSHLLV